MSYTVYASINWVNTGLTLNGTSKFTIEAIGGQWTANPATGMVGANGNPGLIAKPGYTLPGQPEGMLVGYVGTTPPPSDSAPPGVFAIGTSVTFPANNGLVGTLYLSINDDIPPLYGVGFVDNQGSLQVQVTVET